MQLRERHFLCFGRVTQRRQIDALEPRVYDENVRAPKVYVILRHSGVVSCVLRTYQGLSFPAPRDGIDIRPIGYSANKRNFEVAAQYAWKQRLMPRELKLDDLFDATTRALD